ncbi:MAG: DUF1036 domain-containing protein [Acetobacteraceae bacterium]
MKAKPHRPAAIVVQAFAAGAALWLLGSSAPAHAGLTLCNKALYQVAAAVAFFASDPPGVSTGGDRGGTVHGWAKIEPGACVLVDRNVAKAGEFYYYAETQPHGQHEWGGTSRLCVRQKAFEQQELFLMGSRKCAGEFYPVGFKRIPQANTVEYKLDLIMSD